MSAESESSSPVTRNYAEALLALARKAGDVPGWGRMIDEVATAVRDPQLAAYLASPRVTVDHKNEALGRAFGDRSPRLFVRFLQAMVSRGRQRQIAAVAEQYAALVDEAEGRVHAQVTLAKPPTEAERASLAAQLSRALGKQVVPHVAVNPEIIGGVVVRIGDRVMDGSVRRRLGMLRRSLLQPAVSR